MLHMSKAKKLEHDCDSDKGCIVALISLNTLKMELFVFAKAAIDPLAESFAEYCTLFDYCPSCGEPIKDDESSED